MPTLAKDLRRIKQVEQQRKALQMRRAGAHYDQIASALGYSDKSSARRCVMAAIADIPREDAAEVRVLELARLDDWLMRLAKQIQEGDTRAIATGLSIMDRRAKFLGLDAPRVTSATIELNDTRHSELVDQISRFISAEEEAEASGEADNE